MPVTDSIYLLAESREHPMHVGSLALFTPPDDAGPGYVRSLYEGLLSVADVDPLFRKRPAHPVSSVGNLWWASDSAMELDYHVRLSALPAPYRVRELLNLISRLHSTLLDRHRPLWEMHLIEGLEDGRFGVYTKLHHALLDGVSALRLLQRTLSTDPAGREASAPWNLPRAPVDGRGVVFDPWSLLRTAGRTVGDVVGLVPVSLRIARTGLGPHRLGFPYQAPRTMLNVTIGGARRFAAQSWDLGRITTVRRAVGVTFNDLVLAMCAGALRSYLLEQNALPEAPLIAMVPVSLRGTGGLDSGGNSVAVALCNLCAVM